MLHGPLLLLGAAEDETVRLLELPITDDDETPGWLVAGLDVTPPTLLLEKVDVAALELPGSDEDGMDEEASTLLEPAMLLADVPALDAVLLPPTDDTVCEVPPLTARELERDDPVVEEAIDELAWENPPEEPPPEEPWLVLSTQTFCRHPCPAAQSESCVQDARHTPPVH